MAYQVEDLKDDREEFEEEMVLLKREVAVLAEEKRILLHQREADRDTIRQMA